jgi:hypothetical protein
MLVFRPVVSVLVRFVGRSFSTNSRPALRYRLWHAAGRISRHARRLRLRLQRTWPWAADLVRAFRRLDALPLRC